MKINPIKPKESVQSCIDRPDMRLALVLTLLPPLVSTIGTALFGFPIIPATTALSFVRSIANWLLISIAAYVILYLFKGKTLQGKFSGVASAISLLWIVSLLLTLIGFVFVPLAFSGEILQQGKMLATGQIGADDFVAAAQTELEKGGQPFGFEVGLVFMLLGALLTLFSFYLVYLLVRDLYASRVLSNLVVTLLILIAWLIITSWVLVLI